MLIGKRVPITIKKVDNTAPSTLNPKNVHMRKRYGSQDAKDTKSNLQTNVPKTGNGSSSARAEPVKPTYNT
jgi:hypothetical protein